MTGAIPFGICIIFIGMLCLLWYQILQLIRSLPGQVASTKSYARPDDRYTVPGEMMREVQDQLSAIKNGAVETQQKLKNFITNWAIGWTVYAAAVIIAMSFCVDQTERKIFDKLSEIKNIVLLSSEAKGVKNREVEQNTKVNPNK